MADFSYVYVLESVNAPVRHYTGLTDDLKGRLAKHNAGGVSHTSKYGPWRIRVAVAFEFRERAAEFEQYLKSHSGRAFSAKHF